MGTWGVSIMSGDDASDVKDTYLDLQKIFATDEEVNGIMLGEVYKDYKGRETEPIFWYALSLTQWKYGRLTEEVKKKALYYIDHPEEDKSLEIYEEAGEKPYKQRLEKLQELKATLNSAMPAYKKISKYKKFGTGHEIGDIIAYRIGSNFGPGFKNDFPEKYHGKYQIYIVLEKRYQKLSRFYDINEDSDVGSIFKWYGTKFPDIKELKDAQILYWSNINIGQRNIDNEEDRHDIIGGPTLFYKARFWQLSDRYCKKLGNDKGLAEKIMREHVAMQLECKHWKDYGVYNERSLVEILDRLEEDKVYHKDA